MDCDVNCAGWRIPCDGKPPPFILLAAAAAAFASDVLALASVTGQSGSIPVEDDVDEP